MGLVTTLDPRVQPITTSFVYTLDPRTQPLQAAKAPEPVVVHGGKPAPFAKSCTWEEYLADPWRCQYAEISDRPPDLERALVEAPPSAQAHIAAIMGLEMDDKDAITRMAASMALRMLE